ncbi:hypothetical protein KFL_003630050 [Klebsormidium nitens]|uniref:Uncharacterized protein n=1 Tax=Klebsormidium nitens TaxID=105231 RepID=A0A1Y1IDS5_KLENI|nr:hypothetical protein KFL_003630050 [Klebsormidium nitens]|eukprot:GAQ87589.1 hypothetical protein KFL_003630050 [Klebsormidium nitens]
MPYSTCKLIVSCSRTGWPAARQTAMMANISPTHQQPSGDPGNAPLDGPRQGDADQGPQMLGLAEQCDNVPPTGEERSHSVSFMDQENVSLCAQRFKSGPFDLGG